MNSAQGEDVTPVFEVRDLRKNYGGLRPLRLRALVVRPGDTVAIVGLDAPAAETFVNLLTGATLPDTGEIRVFGRATSDITDADDWLATIDRFGIVSDRAVLLDELSTAQNLAMPMTLDVDPMPPAVRGDVNRLAAEVSLAGDLLDRKVATLDPAQKLRVRLGRAVALSPGVLLMEHPTASLPDEAVPSLAADLVAIAAKRTLTVVAVTADVAFATAITSDAWKLIPADGTLVPLAPGAWARLKRVFGAGARDRR